MRVEFDYTIEDMVDVQMRALKRSRAARAWRWRDLVMTSLLTGALLFAVIPEEITGRIIVGIIGLFLGAVLYPVLNEMTVKRRLRKWCEEHAGTQRTFTFEVELNQSGIHTRSNGTQIIYAWENVKEIKETEDSVDIYFEKGGLVVVRKRAFPSPGEHERFIELAKQYLKMAHESHQPNGAS
jgi:YcxB-like protein